MSNHCSTLGEIFIRNLDWMFGGHGGWEWVWFDEVATCYPYFGLNQTMLLGRLTLLASRSTYYIDGFITVESDFPTFLVATRFPFNLSLKFKHCHISNSRRFGCDLCCMSPPFPVCLFPVTVQYRQKIPQLRLRNRDGDRDRDRGVVHPSFLKGHHFNTHELVYLILKT